MSCTSTGQANGIVRCEISGQNNFDSVTFVPDESHSVKRGNSTFATFLPIEGDNREGGSGSKSGFLFELGKNGGLDLKCATIEKSKNATDKKRIIKSIECMKQAALYAASHGTKVTIEVTKDTNDTLTLTKMTVPAK